MNASSTIRTIVITAGVTALVVTGAFSLYIQQHLTSYKQQTIAHLNELAKNFFTEAERTDRTEVTKESAAVVLDCSERAEFETLLSTLDTLSPAQQNRLLSLYPGCASYYQQVKAFHTERLGRLILEYTVTLEAYERIFARDESRHEQLSAMQTLTDKETERAGLMHQQVVVQKEIIDALVKRVNTAASVQQGQTIGLSLSQDNVTIDALRKTFSTELAH